MRVCMRTHLQVYICLNKPIYMYCNLQEKKSHSPSDFNILSAHTRPHTLTHTHTHTHTHSHTHCSSMLYSNLYGRKLYHQIYSNFKGSHHPKPCVCVCVRMCVCVCVCVSCEHLMTQICKTLLSFPSHNRQSQKLCQLNATVILIFGQGHSKW